MATRKVVWTVGLVVLAAAAAFAIYRVFIHEDTGGPAQPGFDDS